ncbi:MAG: PLP-dependent transferase, partial [Chloroherpetonaceae bacterium]|nr:PLP-dependent transferase [Chloroherpetonaceae bacterium]
VATIAKSKGIFTLCDNTFATPLVQQPLQWGIDAVVHSATKFLGGHSDLTAGVVCGSKAFIEAVWKKTVILGCALSAFDAWLLLRGLRTLSLRVRQANETAAKLAAYLHSHPKVACVYHPSLPSHPQHALACKQMQGFTAMLSFELRGRSEQERFRKAQAVIGAMKLATNAVSLGGVESLVVHPASMWSAQYTPEQLVAAGIPSGLVRVSVGLEHADDLLRDFAQALEQV